MVPFLGVEIKVNQILRPRACFSQNMDQKYTKPGVESIEHDSGFRFQGAELARDEPGMAPQQLPRN